MKRSNSLLLLVSALCALFLCACSKHENKTVDKLLVIRGANQCALPNSEYGEKLKIEALGPLVPGLLGGKGSRDPAVGVKLKFEALPGSDIKAFPEEIATDNGGGASVVVKSGSVVGDQYLRIVPEDNPKAAITVRFINGVLVKGSRQEAFAGNLLKDPVQIQVIGFNGKPLAGCPVYFNVSSSPEKKLTASCKPAEAVTDANGMARASCKVGKATGEYVITAEVADPVHEVHIRGIEIPAMGLNVFSLAISVLGGLALFIFGMTLMSDGLQMVSGEKMKRVLHLFSSNRFVAVLAGTVVTGIIQSSSACTVMVVGFVNAGLLSLAQAIGIIFGANIGTTATAQLISFDLGFLALPAVTIGVLMVLLWKNRIKDWGQMLLGFGLLFYGMGMMSEELKIIGSFPSFVQFFSNFDCTPVNGRMPFLSVLGAIGIGTAMTVLIQSSSATIGIALALAGSGLINFYTAVPLILGDNIGTTITAILAALNANRRAKQAAVGHVLFNVLGATYMVLLFYVPYPGTDTPIFLYFINAITSGDVFAAMPENIERHIAVAHTMFNVFNVIIFLPFIAYIVKLCNIIVKIENEKKLVIQYLEPHLLDTPSVAIEQAIKSLRYMLKEAWYMVDKSFNKSFIPARTDKELSSKIEAKEKEVDKLQQDITEYLVQITRRELAEPQAELIPLLMHCTNDAERIGDHADNILRLAKRFETSGGKFSDSAKKEMEKIWGVLKEQAENVIDSLDNTDRKSVSAALKDEKQINKYAKNFEKEHVKRLKKGSCDIAVGIIFIEMLAELERIGDHLTNIAERAPEIQKHQLNL